MPGSKGKSQKGKRARKMRGDSGAMDEYIYRSLRRGYLKKIARRAGIKRISKGPVFELLRKHARTLAIGLVNKASIYAEHNRRKTITSEDIVHGLKRMTETSSKHYTSA